MKAQQSDRLGDTRQRFEQTRYLERQVLRLREHVEPCDSFGNEQVLRVCAKNLSRHDALAQVFLTVEAPKARLARRRVDAHNRLADRKWRSVTDGYNHAAVFMAERARHRNHGVAPQE